MAGGAAPGSPGLSQARRLSWRSALQGLADFRNLERPHSFDVVSRRGSFIAAENKPLKEIRPPAFKRPGPSVDPYSVSRAYHHLLARFARWPDRVLRSAKQMLNIPVSDWVET